MCTLPYYIPEIIKSAYLYGELTLRQFTRLAIYFNYGMRKAGHLRPGVFYIKGYRAASQFENSSEAMRKTVTEDGARWAFKQLVNLDIFEVIGLQNYNGPFSVAKHGVIVRINLDDIVRIDPRDLHQPYLNRYNKLLEKWALKVYSYEESTRVSEEQSMEVSEKLHYARNFVEVGEVNTYTMTISQYNQFIIEFIPFNDGYEFFTTIPSFMKKVRWLDQNKIAA